ncbi:MAG: NAD+ synthase [Rhodospirillaceae bacterium]|jgi:NAD+ synthase|nr:NAD+ synthase [Rhodospirillaceae bacterium]MBT5242630.1 NAD+ synthase [Rhodospirillaceae bacterium]MBT5562793.1 NAD+ synthase [Rhodospirillaceae bacterium]MBT6241222.1 NAD+ synthase [Rhodospirillaceae bacterium]MBT7137511.1 NAD+ synthase [Rhodospirillaceae bacterium]
MTETLNIAMAQLNPTVGDLEGNLELVRAARAQAGSADLLVTGELVLSGYPPEDLVLKPSFQDALEQHVHVFAKETADGGPAVLLGTPWRQDGRLYNAVLLIENGKISAARFKRELPNYGVFDEKRVFKVADMQQPIPFGKLKLGVMICEDMWFEAVTDTLSKAGADLLIVLNGSPFDIEKKTARFDYARVRISETGLPLVYVNLVGGQDELVFDGDSFIMDGGGEIVVRANSWDSGVVETMWRKDAEGWACEGQGELEHPGDLEQMYRAICLGLRDYVNKNGFPGILIGLSGGIDSALSAAVAVDAIGPDRVHCVMMPSPYTSTESLDDAAEIAALLGCRLDSISIEPAMAAFETMLEPSFKNTSPDITEENLQARARGVTLMALSNKFGNMVLSTGNKSEMSVGYATLYGDMCGGYSVLKDIYKTTVFALSEWRNQNVPTGVLGPAGPVMGARVISKPPSAELKPDQKDEDSLPPYDQLDDILHGLIEAELSADDIAGRGHDPATVDRVWRMLDRAEYKRRQAPPGVKISSRAFGRDRRYPITNGFTGGQL